MSVHPSSVRPKRALRRSPSVRVGAVLVALALAVPLTAGAVTSPFNDVSTSHPFFDEILWMSDTGVTQGYPDGSFRPSDPVTRQAMSAFMQRLYDIQEDLAWQASASDSTTSSTAWVDVPGSDALVRVPDGVYADILARFSAESDCSGAAGQYCSVRLVMNTNGGPFTEMFPGSGTDAAFDSGGLEDYWEAHAIERLGFGKPGGSHIIKAQYRVSDPAVSFRVDDWVLVAETDLQVSGYIPL